MNIASLERALRNIVTDAGYDFATGNDDLIAQLLPDFPSAWLTTPKMLSIDGQHSGRITYELTLRLFDADTAPHKRPHRLIKMQCRLLDILTALSEHPDVVAVENITVTPAANTFTLRGELSQTAKARVTLWF